MAASVSIWHIKLKGSSNKSKFYTSKTYSFSLQQAVKKINSPNILAVSAAGIFVDRETQPWSPKNEVECVNIFVGKRFNGKIWLLQN